MYFFLLDGGEGYTGTLYHKDNVDKTAIIQWDNGNQTLCKIGQMGTYELRIIDSAQIGKIVTTIYTPLKWYIKKKIGGGK